MELQKRGVPPYEVWGNEGYPINGKPSIPRHKSTVSTFPAAFERLFDISDGGKRGNPFIKDSRNKIVFNAGESTDRSLLQQADREGLDHVIYRD